jgi:TPR repeat protein
MVAKKYCYLKKKIMEALKGLYHADKLDEQSFIDNFTIRLKEFKQIIDNLNQQKQKPLQHFLITGKRGMGKSTLLRRIFIEAEKPPLNEKMYAVRLGAEQYRLSRLFKLWEQVIEYLGNKEPKLLEQKKAIENSKQYEENLIHIISDYLTQTGKTLLLLIDNFDQFIEKIPLKDKHALREALMMYPIQIIGNTVFYNEHFIDYGNPFYDFFKPIHLANLDKEEAEDFIKERATGEGIENFEEIFKKQKGKINALRILSGGVPRTLLILLSIVSKKSTGDAVEYLHEMIEQVTPLYQDRMKSLSAQQQEIMHHLAMHWDRVPVKELATEMRIPSKSISAQLVQLENSGYINKVETTNRNNYYEIDERFFNIWLLMSEAAPYDTKRVIWLTKWLDAFYSNDELKDFAMFCQNGLKEAKPANRFLIAQALSESEKLDDRYKKQMVEETATELRDSITEAKTWADRFNKKLTEKETRLDDEIGELFDKQHFDKALEKLDLFEKLNESDALFGKGLVYMYKKDFDNAEKYYQMAVEKGNPNAMSNLSYLYWIEKNDIAGAEKYCQMAAEKGHVGAMNNLGYLYETKKKDIVSAEKYYKMAIEKGNINAMGNLANMYFETNQVPQKLKANELSKKVVELRGNQNILSLIIRIRVLLWNEKVKEAEHLMIEILDGTLHTDENVRAISAGLQYFMVFRQKQFLYKTFKLNGQLIDQYKPIYYALMHEMQDEHPKEYLKMTEELKEPVEAILKSIKSERERLRIN